MNKMKLIIREKVILIYFSFLFINSLFAQTSLTNNQIDTTWWYDNYSNGLEFLKSNDLESAEVEFRKILDKDDNIAHAYYGLGRVYDKKEKDSDHAIENLEKAIEINPELIDAYYYLGLMYEQKGIASRSSSIDCFEAAVNKNPHFIDGWIAWASVIKNLRWPWESEFDSEPLVILAKALDANPADKRLYEQFKRFLFWYSYEDISIPTFKHLINKNPSVSEYAMDMAQALYNLDLYESCLNVIDSLDILYTDYSLCRIYLLRAKILFNTENEVKGLDYYWQAINSISDSLDVNELFSDICYIINNSEFEAYRSTSITDLPDFFARFWLSRDPNLATQLNERIAEHYKRLKYARKNYRRYNLDQSNKKVFIYKSEHELNGLMNIQLGDELLNPLASDALPAKRDLDDMGLIYLRHGEPDNFAYYICDNCPLNLSWRYFERYNRQEMIFHFRKYSGNRGWLMETLPSYFQNRGDFGGQYALLDPSFSRNQDFYNNLWRLELLNNQNIENVKVGLHTETTDYIYEKDLIEFPLEILSFKGENFKTAVDWFYGIEGTDLQLNRSDQGNQLSFSTYIGIFDTTWNEIVRLNYDIIIPLNVNQDEWESSSFIETESFSVPPGDYYCEFQLQDKVSDNLGVYKGSLTIPDYWKNELMLSDIILSGSVSRKYEPSLFKKGDIEFSPHMFSAYGEDETVGLYFEIYNLVYDFNDRTNFEITWMLKEAGEDETEPAVVKSTLQYSGETRDDKIYINLELADTDSGDYELDILVKDMVSGVEVSKKVTLSVL